MPLVRAARARLQATLAWIGTGFFCYHRPSPLTKTIAVITTSLAMIAWFSPKTYVPIQRVCDWLTRALVTGLTWLLLGSVYFGLFTPLRLWRRVRRSDPLRLRFDSSATTYLQPSPPPAPDRFERQF